MRIEADKTGPLLLEVHRKPTSVELPHNAHSPIASRTTSSSGRVPDESLGRLADFARGGYDLGVRGGVLTCTGLALRRSCMTSAHHCLQCRLSSSSIRNHLWTNFLDLRTESQ